MRGFEVHLNGKHLCVAAFDGDGTLVAFIDHIYNNPPSPETWLRVTGSPHAIQENLRFVDARLNVGDEVLVRIVETSEPSEPIRREDVSIPK